MEVRRRRIARNKRRVVFRLLFLVFILLLISAGVVGGILLLQKTGSNMATFTELPFSPSDPYVYTGSGFLYLKNQTLNFKDLLNKNSYSDVANVENIKLAGSPNIHLLYNDYGAKIVDVPYNLSSIGNLQSVRCGNNYVAILSVDAQNVSHIQVFNKSGEPLPELALDYTGKFIMDYGFYTTTSEYLYVTTLSLDSNTPQTTITINDIVKISTSSVMNVQNQLIEQMHFTASHIYAVGTNQMQRYVSQTNQEVSPRITVFGWQVIDFEAATTPLFLLRPRNVSHPGTVKLLIVRETEVSDITQRLLQLPQGTVNVFLMGGKVVAVTPLGYTTFDTNGKKIAEKTFPEPISMVKKLSGSTLLLTKGEAYYTVEVG